MNRTQKDLHIYSVFGLMLLILGFWLLGGGANAEETEPEENLSMTIELPKATEKELADNRLCAIEQAQDLETKSRRQQYLQNNSFDWLEAGLQSKNKVDEKETGEQNKRLYESSILPVEKEEISPSKSKESSAKTSRKDEFLKKKENAKRQRLKELEKKWGIQLDGNDEEAEAEQEPVRKTAVAEEVPEIPQKPKNKFYSLNGDDDYSDGHIKAVVHGVHKDVTTGSVIKMRLLEPVVADGCKISKNSFVYGKLSFSTGRAMVRIENINYKDRIVPFKGSLYDRDGFEGLYVPDNIISDTKKQAASSAVSSADVRVSSPRAIVSSAANAITGAVKSAVSNTIRDPKITISSNYLITIKLN